MCLETQFDSVIVDRPMILQTLYQLHNSLSDRRILSWDFFLNRFDALFLEAQINLEKSGDISCLRGKVWTFDFGGLGVKIIFMMSLVVVDRSEEHRYE